VTLINLGAIMRLVADNESSEVDEIDDDDEELDITKSLTNNSR